MKIRVRFSKKGDMRFIGHLDVMRHFQKAIRRSGLNIRFSEGMSPHMIMSFASPLGLGMVGYNEYVDMEMAGGIPCREIVTRLDEAMGTEEIRVLGCRKIEEGRRSNGMAIVTAAQYRVSLKDEAAGKLPEDWDQQLIAFCGRDEIMAEKKTKKGTALTDIRPLILNAGREPYDGAALPRTATSALSETGELMRPDADVPVHADSAEPVLPVTEGPSVCLLLASGSTSNLKIELVLESFCRDGGYDLPLTSFRVERLDLYTTAEAEDGSGKLISMAETGEEV